MSRFDNLGHAIRWLRQQRGMSQKVLAERAGLTPSMLSGYERQNKVPSVDSLGKILDALDVYMGRFDDALDIVNERPLRRHELNSRHEPPTAVSPMRLTPDGVDASVDIRRLLGVEDPIPAELERALAEMVHGCHRVARFMCDAATRLSAREEAAPPGPTDAD